MKWRVNSFVCIFLLFLPLPVLSSNTAQGEEASHDLFSLSYTSYEPFNVTSDADFAAQGWNGNGSENNPYRIEGLNISNDESMLIWIVNTSSHFTISDCYFSSTYAGFSPEYSLLPVTMDNVTNGELTGNQFTDCLGGLSLHDCRNMTVAWNNFSTSSQAISAREVNQSVFEHNLVGPGPVDFGIWLSQSFNTMVGSNNIPECTGLGIQLSHCTQCNVLNNTIAANGEATGAISIFNGESCNCTLNQISNNQGEWLHAIDCAGSNHKFLQNAIANATIGIYVRAVECYLANNSMENCGQAGIELIKSNNTIVISNTISGSSRLSTAGISILGGRSQQVRLNNLTHSAHGIGLQGSLDTEVFNNTCNDTRYGIALLTYGRYEVPDGPSTNCSIEGNRMSGGGIIFSVTGEEDWDFADLEIVGNRVGNRSILYCDKFTSTEINGSQYGQIILMRCENMTIRSGQFQNISSDIEFSGYEDYGYASPIHVIFCENCTISGITTLMSTIGISIFRSTDIAMEDCLAAACSWTGIFAVQSGCLDIEDFECHNSNTGITMQWAWDCFVNGTHASLNERGIFCIGCLNCTIKNALLYNCSTGLKMEGSDACSILSCEIILCSTGINLQQTSYCQIQQNIVMYSTFGIYLDSGSDFNWIYENYFVENDVHAICAGTANHWDDGIDTGNYWDDAQGSGPYSIDENDVDNYPIPSTQTTTGTTTTSTTTAGFVDGFLYISAASGLIIGVIATLIMYSEKRNQPS